MRPATKIMFIPVLFRTRQGNILFEGNTAMR